MTCPNIVACIRAPTWPDTVKDSLSIIVVFHIDRTEKGYHHDDHGEDLLVSGVGRDVAEADGGEGGAGEVQGSHVSVAVLPEIMFSKGEAGNAIVNT